MTPAGIEPATFRFVAQHLNHCATAVLPSSGRRLYIQLWYISTCKTVYSDACKTHYTIPVYTTVFLKTIPRVRCRRHQKIKNWNINLEKVRFCCFIYGINVYFPRVLNTQYWQYSCNASPCQYRTGGRLYRWTVPRDDLTSLQSMPCSYGLSIACEGA